MAGELQAYTDTGLTLYAVIIDKTGQAWNTDSSAFETFDALNWSAYYGVSMPEAGGVPGAGGGIYLGDMPGCDGGVYSYVVYEQAGASPNKSDTLVGNGSIEWNGDEIVGIYSVLVNNVLARVVGFADSSDTANVYVLASVLPAGITGNSTFIDAYLDGKGDDYLNGYVLMTQSGQRVYTVTDFDDTTDTVTIDGVFVAADEEGNYLLVPWGPAGGGGASAADVWAYETRTLTALDEDDTTIDIDGTTIGTVTTVTNGVTLADTQGAITWGQQKILADVAGEGALHVVNDDNAGIGQYNYGHAHGQYNEGDPTYSGDGQYNFGAFGQTNSGSNNGQFNQSTTGVGQNNSGGTSDVVGFDDAQATQATVAAIKLKTDNLPSDPADESHVLDAITAATGGLSTLTAAGVWQYVIETLTAEQIMRITLAALAGKASGGGTSTITFRDKADSKARITLTVDSVGDRSAVVVDGA